MVDGRGNATPHGTVFKLPYFRLQSGANAVIMDPVVGDIGIMLICDRDVSSVEASQDTAPPPSMRTFNFSDGLFIGGILGTTMPTQYLAFTASGIVVGGNIIVNGNITTTGDVTAGTISLKTHQHSGVATGGGVSGPPV
jgi:phage baseplate assembly protein gpV